MEPHPQQRRGVRPENCCTCTCTCLRVVYHTQALTLYTALALAAALAAAQAGPAAWAKATAIFCGARLGWFLWGALQRL